MSKSLFNLFFNSVFLFHEKTVDQMILDRYYDNTKAKKMLGYEPKYNFEEGMNHTIKNYYDKNYLKRYKISPIAIICIMLLLITYLLLF